MEETKFDLLTYIKSHPGIRKREIPNSTFRLSYPNLLTLMSKLEQQGYIIKQDYRDFANMEYYDKFYISEKGISYINSQLTNSTH